MILGYLVFQCGNKKRLIKYGHDPADAIWIRTEDGFMHLLDRPVKWNNWATGVANSSSENSQNIFEFQKHFWTARV